jgi:hypothetical protein
MPIRTIFWLVLLLMVRTLSGQGAAEQVNEPYPAHAHNDYNHERPLRDAMEHNFRSIEADVYSGGDSLYVAHNRRDISPGRTLRALYLDPLSSYLAAGGGTQYDSSTPLILLIDIKDNGLSTYQLLHRILQGYREMLCSSTPEGIIPGRVVAIVSGNRPIDYMMEQDLRFAFVDGRMKDLAVQAPASLMPLVSDNWTKYFDWSGEGEVPSEERVQLNNYINQAHENGQMIRFWATPDSPGKERNAVWTLLLEAGVDLINTDDLEGLRVFIATHQP